MSHFSLLVVVPKNEVESMDSYVNSVLEPYNENMETTPIIDKTKNEIIEEMNGVKEKLDTFDWMNKDTKTKYKRILKKMDIKEFCKDYYGQEVDNDCNSLTTYNPDSKWDWWSYGGRWNGVIKGKYKGSKDGFNFGEEYRELKENTIPLKEYLKGIKGDKQRIPFAMIDSNGEWIESCSMGWWGIVSDKKSNWDKTFLKIIKEEDKDSHVVMLDCHI